MLQTGTGPASGFDPTLGPPNVTLDESITEFSMWAILASPLLFTTPIMNCTAAPATATSTATGDGAAAAAVAGAVAPLSADTSSLSSTCACTKRLSTKAACVEGKTFGCLPDGTMWAVGCRGMFTCDGVEGVRCDVNTPDPPRNHTCKCVASPSPPPHPPPSGPGSPPMSPKHCKGYLNDVQRTVLLNKEVIDINQQITPQGFPTVAGDASVWARNLSDGSVAVALYNEVRTTPFLHQFFFGFKATNLRRQAWDKHKEADQKRRRFPQADVARSIGITSFTTLGWTASSKARVRDLWAHTENGTVTGRFENVTVRAHATVVVRLYPVSAGAS
jgi:hypothetical protein